MTGFLQDETERFRKALQDIDGDMIKVIKVVQRERDGAAGTPRRKCIAGWQALQCARLMQTIGRRQLTCLVSCSSAATVCSCISLSALLASVSQPNP